MNSLTLTHRERSLRRRSWRWSLAIHVTALASLYLVCQLWLPVSAPQEKRQFSATYSPHLDEEPLVARFEVVEPNWLEQQAEEFAATGVDVNDPRWNEVLAEPLKQTQNVVSNERDEQGSSLLSETLMRQIAETSQRSSDENFDSLDQLSNRLSNVSSEAGVDEVSGTVTRLIGVEKRETKPKEGVGGDFDFSSGEVHDCRKELDKDGNPRYIVVMIDAAGRTQESEINETDGAQLHRTMQIVKSNPLLERVYRNVVMSLMDKLLKDK